MRSIVVVRRTCCDGVLLRVETVTFDYCCLSNLFVFGCCPSPCAGCGWQRQYIRCPSGCLGYPPCISYCRLLVFVSDLLLEASFKPWVVFFCIKRSLMSTKGSRDLLDQCQFDILLQEKLAGCLAAGAKNGNDMFPLKCISI